MAAPSAAPEVAEEHAHQLVAQGGLVDHIGLAGDGSVAWALEHQVRRVEEPYLRDVHGDRYAAYRAEVGRFVPGVGRG